MLGHVSSLTRRHSQSTHTKHLNQLLKIYCTKKLLRCQDRLFYPSQSLCQPLAPTILGHALKQAYPRLQLRAFSVGGQNGNRGTERHRFDYSTFDYSTGASCKTLVKQRLCGAGMRWKPQGAKIVLSLRTLVQSTGRRAQFWHKDRPVQWPALLVHILERHHSLPPHPRPKYTKISPEFRTSDR